MKKHFRIFSLMLSGLLFTLTPAAAASASAPVEKEYSIRYMTNYSQTVALQSGRAAKGENLLFLSEQAEKGAKLTPPDTAPERTGYLFDGWYLDKEGTAAWNFEEDVVSGGVTLFAKWKRDEKQETPYTEPALSFREKVETVEKGLRVEGVLGQPLNSDGSVDLTAAGILRLTGAAEDVHELMDYRRDPGCTLVSAVYSNSKITVSYRAAGDKIKEIPVNDVTYSLAVGNSTYEGKAQKYEKDVFQSYGIVMGGSSSMENWATSTADMQPLTTINHGIGGTTVDQWQAGLARRLLYPYLPRAVVLYVGINNIINAGDSGEVTGNKLKALFDDIHAHLPETTIYYILINTVPLAVSKGVTADIDRCNEMVTEYAAGKSYMQLIDAGEKLMKESGRPNTAYFLKIDGLHMTLSGYVLWGSAVKEAVISHEKEIYQ